MAQEKLRSVAGRALEEKQRGKLLEGGMKVGGGDAVSKPTTSFVAVGNSAAKTLAELEQYTPMMAVPIMKSLDKPPPSFESMKFPPPTKQQPSYGGYSEQAMVGHGMNSRVLRETSSHVVAMSPPPPPPPSFDFVEQRQQRTIIEPSAPTISPGTDNTEEEEEEGNYDLISVMPVACAPPPMIGTSSPPPPPSYAEFEMQCQVVPSNAAIHGEEEEEDAFAFDEIGNPLSHEQRQALIQEQRQLYEQIMKEKVANDSAIASAKAEAFDQRSSISATRAMMSSGGESEEDGMEENALLASRMNLVGWDSATRPSSMVTSSAAAAGAASSSSVEDTNLRRMVKIGNNQMVALHGQERTKKAIKEGTAILVQCINCQNWMQVTESATLMFCPVCQVVSPVIKQHEVLTKDEAIQLTMDRKLAEKLQAEYNSQGNEDEERSVGQTSTPSGKSDGYFSSLFGSGTMKYPATAAPGTGTGTDVTDSSWWDKISSIVSYGVTTTSTMTNDEPKERGELGVTYPPGAAAAAQRRGGGGGGATVPATTTSMSVQNEETRGLLHPVIVDDNVANLPAARVAESRPLFSCIADSVSSATSAIWSSTGTDPDLEESLLVTNPGRGTGESSGDYAQLPDQE